MTFSLAVSHESLLAAWKTACKFFLSLVNTLVNAKIAALGERFTADLTLVRLLFSVSSHVGFQSVVTSELSMADVTFKRLFLGVDSSMVLQMTLGRESFFTVGEVAGKRFEAVVHVHVVLEAVLLEELLSTLSTRELRLFITLKSSQ